MTAIKLTVNGRPVSVDVEPRAHLADVLRDELLLTGTHIGCEHGVCGACTVELDGEIVRSCITYAVACDGASVRTIEGFDDDGLMARLRAAFSGEHALQCGYCTPGMLIAARDLVTRKRGLSGDDIRHEMSGNLCRCTGYVGITRAIAGVMAECEREGVAVRSSERALGPAPGPRATTAGERAVGGQQSHRPGEPAKSQRPPATSTQRGGASRPAITVEVSRPEAHEGATRLAQSFVLPHPRDDVWALMSDLREMASCMPGLVIERVDEDGNVAGRFNVRLGPITAGFAGEGSVAREPERFRATIEGRGSDQKSGSATSGRMSYTLAAVDGSDGQPATRVDVIMDYALTGPLAQFGRSGMVADLVKRMSGTFASNLDHKLAGEAVEGGAGRGASAIGLLWGLLRDWFARLFRRG